MGSDDLLNIHHNASVFLFLEFKPSWPSLKLLPDCVRLEVKRGEIVFRKVGARRTVNYSYFVQLIWKYFGANRTNLFRSLSRSLLNYISQNKTGIDVKITIYSSLHFPLYRLCKSSLEKLSRNIHHLTPLSDKNMMSYDWRPIIISNVTSCHIPPGMSVI